MLFVWSFTLISNKSKISSNLENLAANLENKGIFSTMQTAKQSTVEIRVSQGCTILVHFCGGHMAVKGLNIHAEMQ